jgi:16S rRNA (cytosine967-C5)-methyltransferase
MCFAVLRPRSGTWRRSPHLKWTTTDAGVSAAAALQLQLLTQFSARVRPGGLLVYATCSLSRVENQGVAASFATDPAGAHFAPEPFSRDFGFEPLGGGLTILPAAYDTDGFFVAAWRRCD